MKIKENIFGFAEGIAAIVLTVGALTFFKACGEHDGMYMACHWAQNAVALIGAVLILQSLARIFIPNKNVKTGLALASFLLSAAVILIPGHVISLCMMETMRCHTTFQPAVIIVASVLTVISGIDAVLGLIKSGKAK